jgi:hypothetical protein
MRPSITLERSMRWQTRSDIRRGAPVRGFLATRRRVRDGGLLDQMNFDGSRWPRNFLGNVGKQDCRR